MSRLRVYGFLRRNLRWGIALICLLLFFAIAEDLMENELARLDEAGYRLAGMLRCAPVTAFFKLFTNLAHPAALIVIGLLLIALCWRRSYRLAIFLNLVLTTLLNLALKAFFLRDRPADAVSLVTETGYSFPSGHAMAATAFYGFAVFLLWHGGQPKARKRAGTACLVLTILLICASRVYLGVHYTSDVLAGCAFSTAYLIGFTGIVQRCLSSDAKLPAEIGRSRRGGNLLMSFAHAFEGIFSSLRTERNLLIHFAAAALVVVFGVLLRIRTVEWLVCILCFGMVISAELINTALEAAVDICSPEIQPKAKLAKDAAAGAVLFSAMAAATAGCVVFLPKIWALFSGLRQ